jgi:hypothetical protein
MQAEDGLGGDCCEMMLHTFSPILISRKLWTEGTNTLYFQRLCESVPALDPVLLHMLSRAQASEQNSAPFYRIAQA